MHRAKEGVGFYRPQEPQESPFYQLVERFYPEFERVYAERYQERYGFWRPIIAKAVERFLDCGDLKKGFARVRCPHCRHELFVAFSCRGRGVCPSCHQKRALEKSVWVAQEVCAEVAHRQFVFTIPKRLRIYSRYDRSLLEELCHRFPSVPSFSNSSPRSIVELRFETKFLSVIILSLGWIMMHDPRDEWFNGSARDRSAARPWPPSDRRRTMCRFRS